MALDIHILSTGATPGQLIYQIDDKRFLMLEKTFKIYETRSNNRIYMYDDLILWGGPAQLVSSLRESLSVENNPMTKNEIQLLLDVLLPLANEGIGIGFFCD
jgi:hypothetical protein